MKTVGRNLVYSSWGKFEMTFKSLKGVSGSSNRCSGTPKIRLSCLFLVCLYRTLYYLLIAQKRYTFVFWLHVEYTGMTIHDKRTTCNIKLTYLKP